MSVGSWDPKLQQSDARAAISADVLLRFIDISQQAQLDTIADVLDAEQQQLHARLMTLPRKAWEDAVVTLSDADVYHLMRFFTVAEMQLPGWEANDKSPVIWLNKILKARGKPLGKGQIQWIKQHTRNRFLPYGSVL
ncbi:MAG: hypothetical protein ACR2P1_18530 [Pseudomonadales bacterium]